MVAPRHLVDEAAHEERFAALREEVEGKIGEAVKDISGIPAGCIVMWSGTTATIPTGWALCNGSNGTPDLRDKFVVGAGSTYAVKATGGAETHSHTATIEATTLTVAQMPSHTHNVGFLYATNVDGNGTNFSKASGGAINGTLSAASTGGGGSHTHTGTAAASSSLPPYFSLAYIMKL